MSGSVIARFPCIMTIELTHLPRQVVQFLLRHDRKWYGAAFARGAGFPFASDDECRGIENGEEIFPAPSSASRETKVHGVTPGSHATLREAWQGLESRGDVLFSCVLIASL